MNSLTVFRTMWNYEKHFMSLKRAWRANECNIAILGNRGNSHLLWNNNFSKAVLRKLLTDIREGVSYYRIPLFQEVLSYKRKIVSKLFIPYFLYYIFFSIMPSLKKLGSTTELGVVWIKCHITTGTLIWEGHKMEFESSILWSDYGLFSSWIRTIPNLLKTFTSNRVPEIQFRTENAYCRYISTSNNPTDIVSRGLRLKVM